MWLGKRAFDFTLALIGLIILSPLFLIVSIWIKSTSKGTVFFNQKRVGLHEKPFYIHKFRTMSTNAEAQGPQLTVANDPRINKCGHFLRKYKLDELPQLINVLFGEMSLVGPRPEVPKYIEAYDQNTRVKIFSVKPGITDWASIKFKNENEILNNSTNPEETYIRNILPVKLSFSAAYIDKASISEDFKIIFLTIFEIIK